MKKTVFLAMVVFSFFFATQARALETIELGKVAVTADINCATLGSFFETARQLVGQPDHKEVEKVIVYDACNFGRGSGDFNKEYILVIECAERINEGRQCVFYGRLIKKPSTK